MTRISMGKATGLLLFWCGWLAAADGRVLVLEDFESPEAAARWQGDLRLSAERASHGRQAAEVRLRRGNAEISSVRLPHDWRGYERLLFDVYYDRDQPATAGVRIDDASENDPYDAQRKIFLLRGWNHVEIRMTPLKAESYRRDLALDRIVRLTVSFDRTPLPLTVFLDNFRLAAGKESAATASHTEPQDTVSIIDNRWVIVRQVARPEDVPEPADVARLRRAAERETALLEQAISAARLQGVPTIYAERRLVVAGLGLRVRPQLAWFNTPAKKREMFSYVADSCRESRRELDDQIQGIRRLGEADDTQLADDVFQPYPPLKGRPIRDWFFTDERGEPMMILSLHSPSQMLQRFFATPRQHIESHSVGGGSRWTIDDSPVYAAFQEDPDTHRVGWDGWCGHLVRDLWSMGGTKRENVVICLESPRIRAAVQEYIRRNIPRFYRNPELLYDIMAYELMYICYCDRSQQAFRHWLEAKHGSIERANELWGASYRNYKEVVAPPVKNSRPLPGTNRALWYDWARFNQDRFTEYLLGIRNSIRALDPSVPLAAGGSSSMLAGRTGTTGIDEERIVNEVDDIIIHEGGGSTLGVDLQLALAEKKKPLADPEMSLATVGNLLPHFLHGKSVAQIYHWPAQPAGEFHSINASSLAHSWRYSLADIDELLRVALDLRRLNKEIAAFVDVPAEVAILYSQTSTLQLPPEMLTWETTPYLAEMEKTYEASRYLDAKVTFVTERQIRDGRLSRYKLLLVPAVRNVPADVVEKIWAYASDGGRVLIVPESFLGDEYNRQQPYLTRLGLSIRRTSHPKTGAGGAMVQGYDQSFSEPVVFDSGQAVELKPRGEGMPLRAEGVRQVIAAAGETLYAAPDGAPAIVRVRSGGGEIYYSAYSLEPRSYARLLDSVFAAARVNRPLRIRNLAGGDTWKLEARTAQSGARTLLYVTNYNGEAARVAVEASRRPVASIRELRANVNSAGGEIAIPAGQTIICEIQR